MNIFTMRGFFAGAALVFEAGAGWAKRAGDVSVTARTRR